MSIAGLDVGSTLVKAYWRMGGVDRFMTAGHDKDHDMLAERMYADGIRIVRRTGIGKPHEAYERFVQNLAPVGAVDDEITLQARGARALLAREAGVSPKKLLVASIGTGVSYAVAKGKSVKRSRLGSCHGGGTMLGLARIIGAKSFEELEAAALKSPSADLLVEDQLPATKGTEFGSLVIRLLRLSDSRSDAGRRC